VRPRTRSSYLSLESAVQSLVLTHIETLRLLRRRNRTNENDDGVRLASVFCSKHGR